MLIKGSYGTCLKSHSSDEEIENLLFSEHLSHRALATLNIFRERLCPWRQEVVGSNFALFLLAV
jgi:hypothetical protein